MLLSAAVTMVNVEVSANSIAGQCSAAVPLTDIFRSAHDQNNPTKKPAGPNPLVVNQPRLVRARYQHERRAHRRHQRRRQSSEKARQDQQNHNPGLDQFPRSRGADWAGAPGRGAGTSFRV